MVRHRVVIVPDRGSSQSALNTLLRVSALSTETVVQTRLQLDLVSGSDDNPHCLQQIAQH